MTVPYVNGNTMDNVSHDTGQTMKIKMRDVLHVDTWACQKGDYEAIVNRKGVTGQYYK